MTEPERRPIHIKADSQGNIVLTFTLPEGNITAKFPSAEAGNFSAEVLNAAYQASVLYNDLPPADPTKIKNLAIVPATNLASGKYRGQETMVVSVGSTAIPFAVSEEKLAAIGQQMLSTFWSRLPSAPFRDLLRVLASNVGRDFQGLRRVMQARTGIKVAKYRRSLATLSSGQSLRIFRSLSISPNDSVHRYGAVGRCIYCGSTTYSERPGIRRQPLGREHIIPEGLGGTLELPEASCLLCEGATGALVEGDVLGLTLKALRLHLNMRSKGRKAPTTLPLRDANATPPRDVEVAVEDYPVFLFLPVYDAPAVLRGGLDGTQTSTGAIFVKMHYDPIKLARTYGITSCSPARWDTHMLFRMLAKIGHSFATAEMPGKFRPALLDVIRHGNTDAFSYIGGEPNETDLPKSTALHEIGLGYQRIKGKDHVVARIRLFARYGGPVYYTVVGMSEETFFTRCRRVIRRYTTA